MRTFMQALLSIVILAGVAGGIYWEYYRPTPEKGAAAASPNPAAARGVPVEVAETRTDRVEMSIVAVGSLLSNESVIIRPEIAGRIISIGFEEGQGIKKGETVIQLDGSTLRAELQQAKANLELSRKNYQRASELKGKGAGTQRSLDEANASLKVNEAAVTLAQVHLSKTVIRAPFSGQVGMRKVSPGDYVNPGEDIVNIEEIDPIKVEFRVPEAALAAVKTGQEIVITLDAFPDRVFIGNVYSIDPTVDSDTRSFRVRARIDNPTGELRPGLFARVTLTYDVRENALLIPEEALVPVSSKTTVFKVVDNKVTQVEVTLGARRDGLVEIKSGLAPGDTVVTAGHQKLRTGAPVMMIPVKTGA